MVNPLLSVEGLTVERGGRTVLSNLSFTLAAGEALLVSGRNGAGKSTLLRTISGLLPMAAGTIRFAMASDEVRGVETAHYLGYEDALKPSLSVGENLEFWAAMLGAYPPSSRGAEGEPGTQEHQGSAGSLSTQPETSSAGVPGSPPEQVRGHPGMTSRAALAALGIARLIDLPAAYLSAGQKRRVALARLLVAPRPLWLLDEPLIALDTSAQATLTALMADHLGQGGAILVASHQPLALPHREIDLAQEPEPA